MFDEENPLQSGGAEAWDRVIDAIDPPAMLLLIEGRMSKRLLVECSAEDIWQEALLHAWRGGETHEWQGLRAFRGWLLAIIENRIRDAADRVGAAKRGSGSAAVAFSTLRRPPQGPQSGQGTPFDPSLPRSTTPSRIATQREQAEAMRQALDALPEESREIVRLRVVDQMPIDAIATHLSIAPAAVRHRFRKGAERYAAALKRLMASVDGRSIERPFPPSSDQSGQLP